LARLTAYCFNSKCMHWSVVPEACIQLQACFSACWTIIAISPKRRQRLCLLARSSYSLTFFHDNTIGFDYVCFDVTVSAMWCSSSTCRAMFTLQCHRCRQSLTLMQLRAKLTAQWKKKFETSIVQKMMTKVMKIPGFHEYVRKHKQPATLNTWWPTCRYDMIGLWHTFVDAPL
jgi:hypothetical protein